MRPGPVANAVTGALTRRRVQTLMISVVLLISTFAAVVALGLIIDSNVPFDKGFASLRGAEVTASLDRSVATPTELTATARLRDVTAAAGPYPETDVTVTVHGQGGPVASGFPVTVVGRPSPGGPVDDLSLTSGHWPRAADQMVLDGTILGGNVLGGSNPVGETVTVTSLPDRPTFTVVGFAVSVTASADGWVLPGQIARLTTPGAPATAQMLYRFRSAGTDQAIGLDVAALRSALPAGGVLGTESYLAVKVREGRSIALYVPFVVAFGVIGLIMSVLIVANVVSGAVVADYTRIGVLKSIGFTPGQVIATYVGQAVAPGAAGCLTGAGTGLVAGILAVPAGIALLHYVLPAMVGTVNQAVPASYLNVYGHWMIAGLAVAGLIIASVGALFPASWAAGTKTVTALRTE